MSPFWYSLLGLAMLMFFMFTAWRLASRREELPCPSWLGWLVEVDNPILRNNSARAIIQHLDLQPGMKVLDFGCGPGRLTIPLARQVGPTGEVMAIDIQAGMLQQTREKAEAAQLSNIQYLQSAAGDGKAAAGEFDRAILVTVLGEVPDRTAILQEIYLALKPGGLLSITEVIADPHFQRRRTVRKLADAIGFRETGFYGSQVSYTLNLEKPLRLTEISHDDYTSNSH